MTDEPTSKVEILPALQLLQWGVDTVVKAPAELPSLARGKDIDIFSLRPERLLDEFRKYFSRDFVVDGQKLNVSQINGLQWHFDVLGDAGELIVRFDIYGNIPDWQHFRAKESLFAATIASSVVSKRARGSFPTPSLVYNALVRHFEQLNALGSGRLKNHHTDWILKSLTPDQLEVFWESFHFFLQMPEARASTNGRNLVNEMVKYSIIGRVRKLKNYAKALVNAIYRIFRVSITPLANR